MKLNQTNEAMKTTQIIFTLFLFSLFQFFSCGGDDEDSFPLDGTVLTMAEIAGNWTAIAALYTSSSTGPIVEYNVIDEGGSVSLTIQSNGRFTLTLTIPDEGNTVYTGQLGFDEDLLVVTYDDEPDDWEYFGIFLDGGHLFINGPAEFDFNSDAIPEEADVSFDFVED